MKSGKVKKSIVSFFLMLGFLLMTIGATNANSPSDIDNNWAKATINQWVDRGWAEGHADGTFKPNNEITRAEVAALINRAFGFRGSASKDFKDVKSTDWYYKDVSAAVDAKYMTGYTDGTFKPNEKISRQELAVMAAKILKLANSDSYRNFVDTVNSPAWSKGGIGAVIDAKIISGFPDKSFRPYKLATRAEVIVILDKAFKLSGNTVTYNYSRQGTYGPSTGETVVDGNVVVKAPGITLRNLSIKGDLLLEEGIGDGEAYLENVTVSGKTTIKGGGSNSIHFKDSALVNVIVNKTDDKIRIVIEGITTIQDIIVESGAKLEEADDAAEGGVKKVTLSELLPAGSKVELVGSFDKVDILTTGIRVIIPKGSVQQLIVAPNATNTNIDLSKDTTIVELVLDANANIVGEGKIEKATINSNGSTLEKKPETVKFKEGVTAKFGNESVPSNPTNGSPPVSTPPPTAAELAATADVVDAEVAANELAGDGTDAQATIGAAQGDRDAAMSAVTALPSSTAKTSLVSRLTAVQSIIDNAQDALDAVKAATAEVEVAEAAANGLTGDGTDTQAAIDAAQGDRDATAPAVTALPNSTAKTSLMSRLAGVQSEIDDAQVALDAVIAATMEVDAAEVAVNGLAGDGTDTQAIIDAAQSDYNAASTAVDALPSSTAKTSLMSRLAGVQSEIDDAQDALDAVNAATAEVEVAEAAVNGLAGDGTDTQAAIDAAQGDRDAASPAVTALPDSTVKTSLMSRLAGVQSTIDDAQDALEALDAINAATAEVEAAEASANGLVGDGTDAQAAIDAAQGDRDVASPAVTALPNSTAKTSLTNRLAAVQAEIDDAQDALDSVNAAIAEVDAAEASADGLAGDGTDTQAAIDAAQSDYNATSTAVDALPSSTAKISLISRLAAVQSTIDDAQDALDAVNAATVEVDAAEASANGLTGDGTDTQATIDAAQGDRDAASPSVTALPNSTAKTSLTSRLAGVQSTIDDAQNALDAVNAATAEVEVAEAVSNGLTGDGTDTQATIDAAQGDRDAASPSVTALPNSTAKTSLTSRLAGVQSTIDDAQNALDAVNAATAEVEVAEAVSNGLTGDGTDTQAAIDTVQGNRDAASPTLTALPNSTAKTSLTNRLAAVQSAIDAAQVALDAVNAAIAEVEVAEVSADGLAGDGTDTQAAINAAQSDRDAASSAVTALPSSTTKTSLDSRMTAVQSKIDDAQSVLDQVNAATAEVDAAEAAANGLAEDGTDTQAAIDAAQGDRDAASPSVNALPNSAAKTSLTSRLAGVQSTIDDAQDALDAVNAATAEVEVAEAAANGLTGDGTDTQAAIDTVQGNRDATSPTLTALPNSTAKTSLTNRLAAVQSAIDAAQVALDAVNAAITEVEVAEAAAIGLAGDGMDTQAAIDAAQSDRDAASSAVTALPSSTTKTSLDSRITAVQSKIDDAQSVLDQVNAATAEVDAAEAAANGLAEDGTDTQAAIDAAQGDRDAASPSVTALPNSAAKTSLMSRLAAVQTTIDDAQDVLDAVNAATVEVGAAEAAANGLTGDGTDTQAAIDAAQSDYNAASTVVDALPNSTAKTLLMSSLATVQAEIDYAQDAVDAVNAATAEVDAAEAAAIGLAGDGTDTQAAIDSAQSTYNVISTTVNALPNSTAKTSLTSRLAAVQATISGAQNNLDIIVGLQEATADATALIEINYTATSWALLQASLALPQSDLSEKANKLAALNQAIDSMVLRVITSITISTWDTFPLVMTSPGAYLHSPFLAKVLDQFGIEMTTESVIWSMSGNHPSDLLQSQTALGVTLSIQHNDSPRTVILKATSSKDANVMGSFSAQIVLPG